MTKVFISVALAALALACLPLASQAITIVPTYVNGSGQTWDTTRKAVIQQAINEWQHDITDSHVVNIKFDFAHDGTAIDSYLGEWQASLDVAYGTDVYPWTSGLTHTIHFNVDLFSGTNYLWWDPTPTTSSDQPFMAWDALSIARHELGHALGFASGIFYDNIGYGSQFDKWTSHVVGSTFDPSGLKISLASATDDSHVLDYGNTDSDLMVPALINSERHSISNIDLNMLHLAYGYNVVLPYLQGDGDRNGTVNSTDLGLLLSHYNQIVPAANDGWLSGDFDYNGTVNSTDLGLLLSHYNQVSPATSAVPEPSTLLLAIAGLVGLLCYARRKQ